MRTYLAWKSIEAERETLNLDPFQANQARTKREESDATVAQRIPETYSWLLAPVQEGLHGPIRIEELRLNGQDYLPVRASRKLHNDGLLAAKYAGTNLRLELDRVPLWHGDHVGLKDLAEYFAQYLYLPRLRDTKSSWAPSATASAGSPGSKIPSPTPTVMTRTRRATWAWWLARSRR